MARELIFVPGHGYRAFEDYPATLQALEEAGFSVGEIVSRWKANFEDVVRQVSDDLSKKIGNKVVTVVCHSLGVNIALPEMARHPDVAFIAASPSVACKEGCSYKSGQKLIEKMFPHQSNIVSRLSILSLAKKVRTPPERASVLMREIEAKDFPFMEDLAWLTAEGLGVTLRQVLKAPHSIENSPPYIQAIVSESLRVSTA